MKINNICRGITNLCYASDTTPKKLKENLNTHLVRISRNFLSKFFSKVKDENFFTTVLDDLLDYGLRT
jgi:hypothetical protein